jgi:hypothetical protein
MKAQTHYVFAHSFKLSTALTENLNDSFLLKRNIFGMKEADNKLL